MEKSKGKTEPSCPWNFIDIFVFTGLIAFFISKDTFSFSIAILNFLREHFFIFTKEPKLFYYFGISINTIILKIVSIFLLTLIIIVRRVSFRNAFIASGNIPKKWDHYLPLYLILCVVIYIVNSNNVLLPQIPFDSVFIEAKIIGNVVIIFSILVVAPITEEILFRGFLYPAINKYTGMSVSIILTSLLFAFAHYPQLKDNYFIIFSIFCLSLVITYARAKTGSTKLAIIMHHLYNLVCVSLGFMEYFISSLRRYMG